MVLGRTGNVVKATFLWFKQISFKTPKCHLHFAGKNFLKTEPNKDANLNMLLVLTRSSGPRILGSPDSTLPALPIPIGFNQRAPSAADGATCSGY